MCMALIIVVETGAQRTCFAHLYLGRETSFQLFSSNRNLFFLPSFQSFFCFWRTAPYSKGYAHTRFRKISPMAPILNRSLQLLLFVGTLFHHACSTPVPLSHKEQDHEDFSPLIKRDSAHFSVLGVKGLVDGTHPRLEIRDLEKKEDQWNLFLLGLWRFQNMNQKDKLSYYQIAGMFNEPASQLLITISFEHSLV